MPALSEARAAFTTMVTSQDDPTPKWDEAVEVVLTYFDQVEAEHEALRGLLARLE